MHGEGRITDAVLAGIGGILIGLAFGWWYGYEERVYVDGVYHYALRSWPRFWLFGAIGAVGMTVSFYKLLRRRRRPTLFD